MLPGHRTPTRLLLAALLAAASACSEPTAPAARLPDGPSFAPGANNEKVKIKTLHLATNTLKINGPAVSVDIALGNSGVAIQSGVSVSAEIIQGTVSRPAITSTSTQCLPGDPAGFLPTGTCSMVLPATATSVPGATLTAGLATFILHVYQGTTELTNKSVGVTLVDKPSITALTLASTTLAIDGPGTNYTVSLLNPAGTLQNVLLQGYIVQGTTERAGGGLMVTCGAPIGNLPNGTCNISFGTSASNSAGGIGTLTPGAAQFKLQLIQSDGVTSATFDERTVDITLVSSIPTIESLEFPSPQLVIGGAAVPYTAKIKNPGFPRSPVFVQGEIVQDTPAGTVRRSATEWAVQCDVQPLGTLPTTGTGVCVSPANAQAPGPSTDGTLVPGPARFVAHLIHRTSTGDVELGTKTVEISLLSSATIVSINPTSTYVVLGSGFTSFTAKLLNSGAAIPSGVDIQGWISQPTGARRAAGGIMVQCPGQPAGLLPTDTCITPGDIVASPGAPAVGEGTLAPGPATFELQLRHYDGSTTTILDTKTIPITLVASTPSIVSLQLNSTNLVIGGASTSYTATIYNPTGADLTGVLLQGWMEQGTTRNAASGTLANCVPATPGLVPAGPCTMSFTLSASNTGSGNGTLVAGPAIYRLEMTQDGTLLDSKTVAVTLSTP